MTYKTKEDDVSQNKSNCEESEKMKKFTSPSIGIHRKSRVDVNENLHDKYCRIRRYDASGKYRIGPSFITKAKLAYMDASKPGKLKVLDDTRYQYKSRTALLTYLSAFTEQPEKTEIDLNFISCLLEFGVDINEGDEYGQTILHAIVRDWHCDVAVFAINHHADVNVQDKYGRSPLHLAAALSYADMARVLLVHGGDPNLNTFGELQTPMHYASKYNSIDVLKELVKYQGSVLNRDYKDRTVLFVAAEKGSEKTSNLLIEMGVPSGVYDIHGNSALTHLVERIPSVALQALGQYCELTKKQNQCKIYLNSMETDVTDTNDIKRFAKTPLDVITSYSDVDLIMHPVIQTSIAVKWKMYGRMDTIRKLVITFLYVGCWMAIMFMFDEKSHVHDGNSGRWEEFGLELLFEIPIVLFAIYFFVKDFILLKDAITYHQDWVEWKLNRIRSQYIFCHPAWPAERDKVGHEEENTKLVPSLVGRHVFWFVYECFNLIILSVVIITRVLAITYDHNPIISLAHEVIVSVNMGCAFIRIMKISIRFKYIGVFLKVANSALTSFLQIVFLYVQFYIPFVAAFWLWFAAPITSSDNIFIASYANSTITMNNMTNTTARTNSNISNGWPLDDFFYYVYITSFKQGQDLIQFKPVDNIAVESFISLFHCFTTFISLSIIIAFITANFSTNIKRHIAEASLLQSSILLQLERNLSKRGKCKLANYYEKYCNPLLVDDQPLPEEVHGRNAVYKLAILEIQIKNIADKFRVFEGQNKEHIRKSETQAAKNIYNSIIGSSKQLNKVKHNFHKYVSTDFRHLTRKHQYIPNFLPEILKPIRMQDKIEKTSNK